MQILVATSAEPTLIAASDAFRLATIEIGRVAASVSTRLYSTSITPFGFLIDPEGVTRAKGAVTDESSLRKLVRQGDQKPVNVAFPFLEKDGKVQENSINQERGIFPC